MREEPPEFRHRVVDYETARDAAKKVKTTALGKMTFEAVAYLNGPTYNEIVEYMFKRGAWGSSVGTSNRKARTAELARAKLLHSHGQIRDTSEGGTGRLAVRWWIGPKGGSTNCPFCKRDAAAQLSLLPPASPARRWD